VPHLASSATTKHGVNVAYIREDPPQTSHIKRESRHDFHVSIITQQGFRSMLSEFTVIIPCIITSCQKSLGKDIGPSCQPDMAGRYSISFFFLPGRNPVTLPKCGLEAVSKGILEENSITNCPVWYLSQVIKPEQKQTVETKKLCGS
jgi:hypothetical protein